jgi:DNA-binding Lrp family transcriptional regulator
MSTRTGLTLDETDERILEALYKDARASYSSIAKQLAISKGTVGTRLEQMQKHGVFLDPREIARLSINQEMLGFELTAIIGVKVRSGGIKKGKALKQLEGYISTLRPVAAVYDVTGRDVDTFVVAKFRNRGEMGDFLKALLDREDVSTTSTYVVLSTILEDFRRPIPFRREPTKGRSSRGLEQWTV